MKTISLILCFVLFLTVSVSCVAVKGGSEQKSGSGPTLGQELIDLQQARDSGAISQEEYLELKEKIKKSYD